MWVDFSGTPFRYVQKIVQKVGNSCDQAHNFFNKQSPLWSRKSKLQGFGPTWINSSCTMPGLGERFPKSWESIDMDHTWHEDIRKELPNVIFTINLKINRFITIKIQRLPWFIRCLNRGLPCRLAKPAVWRRSKASCSGGR